MGSNGFTAARDVLLSMVTFGIAIYAIWRGWRLSKHPSEAAPPMTYRFVVWVIWILQNEAAAMDRKAELMKPESLRDSGHYALAVGGGLLVVAGLQVISVLLTILKT
jgi:hypothetical protein